MPTGVSSSFVRGLVAAGVLGAVGVVASAASTACIPDPEGDYKDFQARTAGLGPGQQQPQDASFDSKPPETAVEQLYVGICVAALAAGDPEQALRFYTETKYTPDGSGGKVAMTVTPMVGYDVPNNRYIAPATVSKSETRGAPVVAPEFVVQPNGRFTVNLGTIDLAAEANSISGRAAVIADATLDGLFSSGDRFCSTLGGLLTSPYQYTFNPKENTCLFVKVKDGDPLPKIDAKEFVCAF